MSAGYTAPVMAISPKGNSVTPVTLSFDKFWVWMTAHRNCILRAGTPDAVLFDHDDYHWFMAAEDEQTLLVQLGRGKDLVGEIVVLPNDIAYVQCVESDGDEATFELIVETPNAREVAYHFVMAHGYDEDDLGTARRWTH